MGKLGEGLEFKYESIIPQAPLDMKFHYWDVAEDGTKILKIHTENFKLVKEIDELKEFLKKCEGKLVAFDTETTGLTYGEDKIVGFSLSLDRWSGIYVPIRHKIRHEVSEKVDKLDENGNQVLTKAGRVSRTTKVTVTYTDYEGNLNPEETLKILFEGLLKAKRVIIYNSEFDLNQMKFDLGEGYDVSKIRSFDALILPYLYDPEAIGMASLKALEKRVLGRTVPEFKEVLGKKYENFAEVNPEDGFVYAICDVAGLMGVYEELLPMVMNLLKQFKKPLTVDNEVYNVLAKDNQMVKMFVDYYGHANILIDRQKALKYKEKLEEEQRKVMKEIYEFFDKGAFNLSASSKEFKDVMTSKKVFTGVKTDKGAPSWGKKALGEMKRNIGKIKECITRYNEISVIDGKISKTGLGFHLANCLILYGTHYFKIITTKNTVTCKGLKGETLDRRMFWLSVKDMYIQEMKKVHILELIQKNNSLNKALNSYVDKLTQVDECKMHYRLKGTKSGRLSSGNGSKSVKRKNHYYIDLNAQNLTKPKSAYYKAEKCPGSDPENILNWKFTPVSDEYALSHLEEDYIVEGQDPEITIRGCLVSPKGTLEYSYIPDESGDSEADMYELELEDGSKVQCTGNSVVRVKDKTGISSYQTLEKVLNWEDLKVAGTSKYVKAKSIKYIGKQKVKKLEKGKHDISGVTLFSGARVGSRYVVSLDYDAQEYKLLAVLSSDSQMLQNFYDGIDPHTASAYAIWGKENYNKAKRKKAKIFNFLNNYSGGAHTLSQQLDIPVDEAEEMIRKYNETFFEMCNWKLKQIDKMYADGGVVFNAFGRPRQFRGWIDVIDKNRNNYENWYERQLAEKASEKVKSAVERRVSSHIIQGTAGDILRLVLFRLYKRYFKGRDPHIDFLSTVHDEINYTIDKEYTTAYVRELEQIMTFDTLDKTLPITTSVDIGFTYGNMFPFVWEDESKATLIPKRVHHA